MALLTAATRAPLAPFRMVGRLCALTWGAYSPYMPVIVLVVLGAALIPQALRIGQTYYLGTLWSPDNTISIAAAATTIVCMFVVPAALHRRRRGVPLPAETPTMAAGEAAPFSAFVLPPPPAPLAITAAPPAIAPVLAPRDVAPADVPEAEAPISDNPSGPGKLEQLKRLLPWKLPPELKPTDDMSIEELVEEARSDAPLTRAWGWKDSAALHPQRMATQYLRIMEFLGWLGVKPYLFYGMFVLVGTLSLAGFMTYAIISAQSGTDVGYRSTQDLPWWLGAVTGGIMGLFVTVVGGAVMLSTTRFWGAYSPATVLLGAGLSGIRRVCRTPLLRMAFADRKEPVHIGSRGRSGFAKGRMLLQSHLDFHEVTSVSAFYTAKVLRSTFTGTQATLYNGMVRAQLEAGRIVRERSEKNLKKGVRLDPIGNFGMTLLLAAIVVAALLSCNDVDVTQMSDLAEHLPSYADGGGN